MNADREAAASPARRLETRRSAPRYELRVRPLGAARSSYEVWQLLSPSTPQLAAPARLGGLSGRNLELVEHRVLRQLASAGLHLSVQIEPGERRLTLTEDLALHLGLIFRALAPMRNRDRMRRVIAGIERMNREEAAYWLGMAMHRKRPRRVLAALRLLLAAPGR